MASSSHRFEYLRLPTAIISLDGFLFAIRRILQMFLRSLGRLRTGLLRGQAVAQLVQQHCDPKNGAIRHCDEGKEAPGLIYVAQYGEYQHRWQQHCAQRRKALLHEPQIPAIDHAYKFAFDINDTHWISTAGLLRIQAVCTCTCRGGKGAAPCKRIGMPANEPKGILPADNPADAILLEAKICPFDASSFHNAV